MTVSIRKARQEDAAEISSVIISAIKETNAKDYPKSVIEKLPDSFSPDRIKERMSTRETYVSIKDGMVVGTASLDANTIRSVFVMPELQGLGIGLAIMEHLEALASEKRIKTLTAPSSITAEGFYKRLGYSKIREEHEGVEKIIIMSKIIQAL